MLNKQDLNTNEYEELIHIHVDECQSTQELLKEQLEGFSDLIHKKSMLVSCDNQTSGFGRHKKKWIPLEYGLYFSFTIDLHQVPSFTALEVSLLCLLFFESKYHISLTLKWPNDLWNREKNKCGGILIQSYKNHFLCGVGINLFSDHRNFGGVFSNQKQSDLLNKDKKIWVYELTNYILSHRFTSTEKLKKTWLQKCGHLHQKVIIQDENKKTQGLFLGLGDYGESLIETSHIEKIFNGSLILDT